MVPSHRSVDWCQEIGGGGVQIAGGEDEEDGKKDKKKKEKRGEETRHPETKAGQKPPSRLRSLVFISRWLF